MIYLYKVEFQQLVSRSEKRFDHRFKEAYQNHIKETKLKRKSKVNEKLVKFTSNRNAEIFLNLDSEEKSREEIKAKPRISYHTKHDAIKKKDSISQGDQNFEKEKNFRNSESFSMHYNLEDEALTPIETNYQYLINQASYADNGSINLVSHNNQIYNNDLVKSNVDLEDLTIPLNEQMNLVHPLESHDSESKNEVIRAKAVFKTSGDITSREDRAKALAKKRESTNISKRKSRHDHNSYAIEYTKQDDYLKHSTLRASTNNGWSPKRFKRYPRFTIFLNNFKKEDIISLNPQFLNFLMSPEKAEVALNLLTDNQNLRKFDPFDKVVLSNKGIDNPILTSFRTLAKTNNSLSETFKIIHKKFLAGSIGNNSSFFNKKIVQGKSKSFLLNPPPDLSGIDDDYIKVRDDTLMTTDQSVTLINQNNEGVYDNVHTLEYTNAKIATAKGGPRRKLYDSVDRIGTRSKPFLKSVNALRNLYEQDSSSSNTNNNVTIPQGQLVGNKNLNDLTVSGLHYEAGVNLPEYSNEERREYKPVDGI